MDISAKLTSKGQLTVPKAVRTALGLRTGDRVVFRVDGEHAALARTPDLLDLAGVVEVPADLLGADWHDVRRVTRETRHGA